MRVCTAVFPPVGRCYNPAECGCEAYVIPATIFIHQMSRAIGFSNVYGRIKGVGIEWMPQTSTSISMKSWQTFPIYNKEAIKSRLSFPTKIARELIRNLNK